MADERRWVAPDELSVPVAGGDLVVGRWGRGRRAVVASHGITANLAGFGHLAAALADDDVTFLALDHRGRGGSAHLPGPYGMGAHAADLLAVLDHVGVRCAVLVGHSMGAFVVAGAAERAPERVAGLVLVDGGLPIEVELPAGTSIEDAVHAVIGPALERLSLTFGSREAYHERWRAHPALAGPEAWNPVTEAYVDRDLVADGAGGWRSPVSREAVLADGEGPLRDETARTALARVEVPSTLLWAPRGLLDQGPPGLYPPEVVAEYAGALEHLTAREVDDVNHYTILLTARGADAVAAAVRTHLDQ